MVIEAPFGDLLTPTLDDEVDFLRRNETQTCPPWLAEPLQSESAVKHLGQLLSFTSQLL